MKRLVWLALVAMSLAWPTAALAQLQATTVDSCGDRSYSAGLLNNLTIDKTGNLCSSATGGGGGGGAVTVADGADVTQGAIADAAATAGGAGTVSAKLRAVTTQLDAILTALGTPLQAGGSIGNTTFAATQSGTWTVQPGNTANSTPWLATINQGGNSATVSAGGALKVDGSAATQPTSISQSSLGTSNGVSLVGVNSATALAGNGATGTGSARVTLSNDNTIPTGWPSAANQTAIQAPVAPATATATKSTLIGGQYNATIPTFTDGQQGSLQLNASGSLRVRQGNPYPDTAAPYTASATGTTGATAATLAGAASVTTYICGFSIRANATAAVTGNAVVSGTISGSLNFTQWTAPTASGLGITEMVFMPCVPASGTNTSIVVTSAAPGTGGVVSVTSWGYKL